MAWTRTRSVIGRSRPFTLGGQFRKQWRNADRALKSRSRTRRKTILVDLGERSRSHGQRHRHRVLRRAWRSTRVLAGDRGDRAHYDRARITFTRRDFEQQGRSIGEGEQSRSTSPNRFALRDVPADLGVRGGLPQVLESRGNSRVGGLERSRRPRLAVSDRMGGSRSGRDGARARGSYQARAHPGGHFLKFENAARGSNRRGIFPAEEASYALGALLRRHQQWLD